MQYVKKNARRKISWQKNGVSVLILINDQKQILAFVPSSDMRVNVRRVLAPETAVRATKLWLSTAGGP